MGVATADLFPRISLTGAFGLESGRLADLARRSSRFWSIGLTADLANERYTRGLVDFLNVLESQRQLYTSED